MNVVIKNCSRNNEMAFKPLMGGGQKQSKQLEGRREMVPVNAV